MNAKERVLTVLAGGLPDRIPLGDWAIDHDTVERVIGRPTFLRNKAACQIAFWEGRHAEVERSFIDDTIALHRALDYDIVTFAMASWQIPDPGGEPPRRVDEGTWQDREGRVFKFTAAADDILCVHDPVAEARVWTAADFPADPGPARPPNAASRRVLDAVIGELGCDRFIAGPLGGGEVGMVLPGGLACGCLLLAESPEVIDAAVAHRLAAGSAGDAFIHPGQDALLWGDDFGHKTGTFVSPRAFRRHYKEANRLRVAQAHARGLPVLKHCCGNVNALLDDFVDIGYDAYQSIQPTAGMDIAAVKRSHGDRLTLWGGVALETMIGGTADEVRQAVRAAAAACRAGGRFILGTSHSVAVGTPWENFQAYIDEWRLLRDYP